MPEMSNSEPPDPRVAADLSQWSADTNEVFLRILVACLIGLLPQVCHSSQLTMLSQKRSRFTREWCLPRILCSDSLIGLGLGRLFTPARCLVYANSSSEWSPPRSDVECLTLFIRMSHIPLAIIYSSFTKSFLLFLLTIWRPSLSLPGRGPYRFDTPYENPWILRALEIWDEDKLDREWVVRNVLGGLAAGFGLRGRSFSPTYECPRPADLMLCPQLCWTVIPCSRPWSFLLGGGSRLRSRSFSKIGLALIHRSEKFGWRIAFRDFEHYLDQFAKYGHRSCAVHCINALRTYPLMVTVPLVSVPRLLIP